MSDEAKQNALANVYELAATAHSLRALAGEVDRLLADSMKRAQQQGVSQVLISEAAALTRGRINQIVRDDSVPSQTADQLSRRAFEITNWPDEALRSHRSTFAGVMTFPPYRARRASEGQ